MKVENRLEVSCALAPTVIPLMRSLARSEVLRTGGTVANGVHEYRHHWIRCVFVPQNRSGFWECIIFVFVSEPRAGSEPGTMLAITQCCAISIERWRGVGRHGSREASLIVWDKQVESKFGETGLGDL